ncbi:MAG TPA: hypothetical protein VNO34_01985 [Actinomycetota bacterium]|nr:hypothetical protein [Actinomycetota bacterium]
MMLLDGQRDADLDLWRPPALAPGHDRRQPERPQRVALLLIGQRREPLGEILRLPDELAQGGTPALVLRGERSHLVVLALQRSQAIAHLLHLAEEHPAHVLVVRVSERSDEVASLALELLELPLDELELVRERRVVQRGDGVLDDLAPAQRLRDPVAHYLVELVDRDRRAGWAVAPAVTPVFGDTTLRDTADDQRATARAAPGEPATQEPDLRRWVVPWTVPAVGDQPLMGRLPQLLAHEGGSDAGELDPLARVALPQHFLAVDADGDGAESDHPPGVDRVTDDLVDARRRPHRVAARRRDAIVGQLPGDGPQRRPFGERAKDADDDGRCRWIRVEARLVGVRPAVAVGRRAGGLRLARANAGVRATRGALDDFLPLDLGREGLGRQDEATDRRVLEALGDELQPAAVVGELLHQDVEVRLVAAEAVDRVADHDVERALAHQRAELGQSRPLAVLAAGMDVAEDADHLVAVLGAVLPAGGLLGR